MNSDKSSRNQDSPEITHAIPPRLFPLPKQEPTQFETQRVLIGLFKLGPLETQKEFAERIVNAFKEYQAKKTAKQQSE